MIREAFYNLIIIVMIVMTVLFVVPAGVLAVGLIREFNFDAVGLISMLTSAWLTLIAIPALAGLFLKPYSNKQRRWLRHIAIGAVLISAAIIVYISSIDQGFVWAEMIRIFSEI